ncbi:molecular chaperone HtpG [candidate division KSB1 bacterium]|nr:molecular chaperone HtpG [candidate division KSB1 bacterium]
MTKGSTDTKKYKFKAEISQLLDILVHSLYTNRDIFVRELISNGSDALDKVRFAEIRGEKIVDSELPYEINITLDKDQKKFIIADTGIGMTKDELIANIGTIAHSGSSEFIKKMTEQNQEGPELIGKFGVGFYSVFMAGKEVALTTRSYLPEEKACQWQSDGTGSFTISTVENIPRGTKIEVSLRDDATKFAETTIIENVIKKYSNFVPFPIKINGKQVNTISAIWREPKSSVTDEQYKEFFKFITNSSEDPISHLHLKADVPIQFSALLYMPKTNLEMYGFAPREIGVNLFVKRVLIQEHCEDILPQYLRFLRGVVDSEDLPLNISRETLQENSEIIRIKNVLVKKILTHLTELAESNHETYLEFWKEFGRIFKEGYMDFQNRDKFAELLRFNSSKMEKSDDLTSLRDYVSRMTTDQKEIYYLSGTSRDVIEQNPHLEIFKKKNIEVLYLYEPIDEFVLSGLENYSEKKLKSVDQVDPSTLTSDEKEEETKDEDVAINERDLGDLCTRIKNILGDQVTEVKISKRLTDSPAVLINPDGTMSTQMQKIFQTINQDIKITPKIMEINPKNELIQNLLTIYKQDPTDEFLTRSVNNLYYSIVILDGYLPDVHKMVSGMQDLLKESSSLYSSKNSDVK